MLEACTRAAAPRGFHRSVRRVRQLCRITARSTSAEAAIDVEAVVIDTRVPVTVLTGYLGHATSELPGEAPHAGKTGVERRRS